MLLQQKFAFGNIHDINIKVMSYRQSEFSWVLLCFYIFYCQGRHWIFGIDMYVLFSNEKSLLSFLAISSLISDGDSVVHSGGCREKNAWELRMVLLADFPLCSSG